MSADFPNVTFLKVWGCPLPIGVFPSLPVPPPSVFCPEVHWPLPASPLPATTMIRRSGSPRPLHAPRCAWSSPSPLQVDADKSGELAEKYGVSSIPHFVFLKDGQEVDNLIGANKNELKAKLEKLK